MLGKKKKKENDVFCQYIISGFNDVKTEKNLELKIKMMFYFDKQDTKV